MRFVSSASKNVEARFFFYIIKSFIWVTPFIQLFSSLFHLRESKTIVRRLDSSPKLASSIRFELGGRNELRLRELETLGASPRSEETPEEGSHPRYPILFPSDGLSFLPRRRSALKVIFRRPENVKPSAVSKRSLPVYRRGVSKFPSYRAGTPLSFLCVSLCHLPRVISISPRTSLVYRMKKGRSFFFLKSSGPIVIVCSNFLQNTIRQLVFLFLLFYKIALLSYDLLIYYFCNSIL